MAARGTRNMDAGEEKVTDERERKELRATARRINRRAVITAVVATVVALLFPSS
jgi:hypothetical protein